MYWYRMYRFQDQRFAAEREHPHHPGAWGGFIYALSLKSQRLVVVQ